jgi:hypothetical protein
MNERLRQVMVARYRAEIEDAKYKIKCYSEQEIIITSSIRDLESFKKFFKKSSKKKCTFVLLV